MRELGLEAYDWDSLVVKMWIPEAGFISRYVNSFPGSGRMTMPFYSPMIFRGKRIRADVLS